jgi:hypothetical protein
MVRYVSVFLWLAACAATPLAAAQSSSTQMAGALSPMPQCPSACDAKSASTCTPVDAQAGKRAPDVRPDLSPGALCEVFKLPAYASAWAGYRPWRDEAVGDWRQANAVVARIGGWRAYARETAPIASTTTPAKDAP